MAKKKRSYRKGYKAGKRYRKKGFLGGIKLLDVSQTLYNAGQFGYINAGEKLVKGDIKGAYVEIVAPMGNPNVWFATGLGNLMIGLGRRVVRATGGRFVKRIIA